VASDSTAERKAALRASAKGARGRSRGEAARGALERLLQLEELARARVAAFYRAIGDEVPVEEAAEACRARGTEVVYPVVVGADLELATEATSPERTAVDRVDVFVVPGLLFDRAGTRLGRGGGHYDRLLARRRSDALVVGICYADRVVDALPQDRWDIRVDLVVTDQLVLRFEREGELSP
jgi:5-formyltetrahydrofolate cyclo-ligase